MGAFKLTDDCIWIPLKRGDGGTPLHKKKCQQLFNGMFPGYIDVREWQSPEVWISEFNQHETCWVGVPRDWKDIALQACKPEGVPAEGQPYDNKKYRASSRFIQPEQIAPYVEAQCPDFLNKYYKPGVSIKPIKMKTLPKTLVKDSKDMPVESRVLIPDVGALAPGVYTIGPGADHYATFNGAAGMVAAINAGGAMVGDITGNLNGNITEVATTPLTQTIGAGNTLLFSSTNPHYGDPTQGWLIQHNFQNVMWTNQLEGPGTFELRHMHYRAVAAAHAATICYQVNAVLVAHNASVHDLLVDGNDRMSRGFWFIDADPTHSLYNIVIWDADAVVGTGNGIEITNTNATDTWENLCVYSCGNIGYSNGNNLALGSVRNCVGYDNAAGDFSPGAGDWANVLGMNNLSSDATAADAVWLAGSANNVINTAAALCVQGVNDAVANFMDILVGGPLVNSGDANTLAARTQCIRNRVVPNGSGATSKGPAEILWTPPPSGDNVAAWAGCHIAQSGQMQLGLI